MSRFLNLNAGRRLLQLIYLAVNLGWRPHPLEGRGRVCWQVHQLYHGGRIKDSRRGDTRDSDVFMCASMPFDERVGGVGLIFDDEEGR